MLPRFRATAPGGLHTDFAWTDTFTEESVRNNSLEFERACLLYNLGALEVCARVE